ncbi:MAG: DUF2784 family protein [Bacteroidales bacterium]|nr:DUF2784 family protein [Bacteroidales bacterium]
MDLLKLADWTFVVFHTTLILFNLFGWIWKTFQRLNLATLLLTGGSWVILGLFYGFGYCPLTEWHFDILGKMGYHDLPMSYTAYLLERLTGRLLSSFHADMLTTGSYLAALACSITVNIRRSGCGRRQ